MTRWNQRALFVLLSFLLALATAHAQTYTLTDGNARLEISFADTLGMLLQESLTVDGRPPILGEVGWEGTLVTTNPTVSVAQPSANRLSILWSSVPIYTIGEYTLLGGQAGSGEATLTESQTFLNPSLLNMPLNVLEFNHYQLSSPLSAGDQALMGGPGTVVQTGSLGALAITSDTMPSHYEINEPDALFALIGQAPFGARLSDNPPVGTAYPAVPGPVASAFQWYSGLPANSIVKVATVTKRFTLRGAPSPVPEPGSSLLLATGTAPLLVLMRRKRR